MQEWMIQYARVRNTSLLEAWATPCAGNRQNLTDNPDIYNPTVSILNTTEFIYTVYQNGCMDRDTVELSAYERIGMDIYDPSGQVNIDTALFLLEGETYTMAATPGFESYLWQPARRTE